MRSTSSRSDRTLREIFQQYSVALVAVAVALLMYGALIRLVGGAAVYVLLLPAVAFSAWYCGVGPAVVSIVAAAVGAKYWFVPPQHSFKLSAKTDLADLVVFLMASAFIITAGEVRRRQSEHLRRSQTALEDRVKKRTADLDHANQSLRELTARLMQLQDEERRRFARELHDSVGQLLAGLSMNLAIARTQIEQLSKTAKTLSESEALVQDMSTEVRTISHLLHPPLLDEAGLSSALRWYVDGFAQRSKIKVDLEFPDDLGRFSQDVETSVFRLVQECLTNIHRHSESQTAKVRVGYSDGIVLVEVSDRGKGIPDDKLIEMNSAGTFGVGIRGMQERMRQLGGNLDIASGGHGTIVRARVPAERIPSPTPLLAAM